MSELFYILGSIACGLYIFKQVVMMYEVYRMTQHEKYCEDCADELMGDAFKSMREK